jgi:hypothetical protein
MNYPIRNTLLLLTVALLVCTAGIIVVSYPYRIAVHQTSEKLAQQKKELETLRAGNQLYEEAEETLLSIQSVWGSFPKQLLRNEQENSVVSFEYFNTIASENDSKIHYNFQNEHSASVKRGIVSENTYILTGTAPFVHLYRFIWKLEHNPYVYTIKDIEVQPDEETDSAPDMISPTGMGSRQTVWFTVVLCGYSAALPELVGIHPFGKEQYELKKRHPDTLRINPFNALIAKQVPPNIQSLFDSEKAVLIGLSPHTAYFRDGAGKIWELHAGDTVYLGVLTKIDIQHRSAEFHLNKGGIGETKVIKLEFSNGK